MQTKRLTPASINVWTSSGVGASYCGCHRCARRYARTAAKSRSGIRCVWMSISGDGGLVDRGEPLAVAGLVTAHGAEVDLLEAARQTAGTSIAYGAAIDLDDRRHLGARAAQEQLVAGEELGAVNRALHDLQPELV